MINFSHIVCIGFIRKCGFYGDHKSRNNGKMQNRQVQSVSIFVFHRLLFFPLLFLLYTVLFYCQEHYLQQQSPARLGAGHTSQILRTGVNSTEQTRTFARLLLKCRRRGHPGCRRMSETTESCWFMHFLSVLRN